MKRESCLEPGVYRRGDGTLQIDLNAASATEGNGINLMPAVEVTEPSHRTVALMITPRALIRLMQEYGL